MQPLSWEHRPQGLRAPALLCAFRGWNDAGEAASAAVGLFREQLQAKRFAWTDSEDFFDYQATRPRIRLEQGSTRRIDWPTIEISAASVPRAPRDLVLLSGPEPSLRWRSFCDLLVELAEAIGVQMLVTVGSLLAEVPHSRAVPLTGLASDPSLIDHLGLKPSDYEGPTGVIGALHSRCAEVGLPSVSLWASVPHYVAAAPNPKAALALLRKLEGVVGVSVDATELERNAAEYERQIGLAVQSDPDIQAFVEGLEQATAGEDEALGAGDLPSGDLLAREFQRFLRQRGGDGS